MRFTTVAVMLLTFCLLDALGASPIEAQPAAPALQIAPPSNGSALVYRFTIVVQRPQPPDEAGNRPPMPSPSPIAPQEIRFRRLDATHVRLTIVDDAQIDMKETVIADIAMDGTLHAKLKRGSHWATPIALYDQLAIIAAASASANGASPTLTKLTPLSSSDTVDGKVSAHTTRSSTDVAFDGSGSVTPSADALAGVGGDGPSENRGRGGGFGGGRGGGGMGGGGGRGGGGRGGGSFEHGDRKADMTVGIKTHFAQNALVRADGTESIEVGRYGDQFTQTWSVEQLVSAH